ncbi:tetratricopeptide repeat protein [Alloprevotella tannerae]|uniref:type IX secretion system periplasmic lipoprotein PorW/SprE n=1 Tax=Alloprevotella tannerae TaxID=76122 RepID=UPI0028E74D7F|nr:tetratricopeptide repeat protein [Alloprevotella tannerae]
MKKIIALLILVVLLVGCSTKENTASTRFWQSFTTKYNTYYNGHEAYKEGLQSKENTNKDNYTKLLPVFLVGNEASRNAGSGQFDVTIEKCEKAIRTHSIKRKPVLNANKTLTPEMKAYLKRKEFNPFLKNAWLLMGKAQFQKGEFLEAASTFSYITRLYAAEPIVANEARLWMARCYAQLDWFYDAEDALNRLHRDSIPGRLQREVETTQADLLLRQARYAEALPRLRLAAKREPRRLLKARLYYLLGQLCRQQGLNDEAYKALGRCISLSPPYELAFNARILQTEVVAFQAVPVGQSDSLRNTADRLPAISTRAASEGMIRRLRSMARADKNKDYLDQVYYAMGNIYLARRDTTAAITAYERGRTKATKAGPEKGLLLLRLGELYWNRERFDLAQGCYTEALALIDKKGADYELTEKRTKVLDKLVPHTSAIQLQDSLQALAVAPESERNAAIDRVIAALKKKEAAERREQAEAERQQNGGDDIVTETTPQPGQRRSTQDRGFYFYNPMLVAQGKQDFARQWGRRKNEDYWRRSQRGPGASIGANGEGNLNTDSLSRAADSLAADMDDQKLKPEDDPHNRAYYLKQLPFTEEAKAASNLILQNALFNAGVIEKDDLTDFPLAARTLERLVRNYPKFDRLHDAYYQLYLLYMRWQKPLEAEQYKRLLIETFPDSAMSKRLQDPNYLHDAQFAVQMEDSLYAATYNAYRKGDFATVGANFERSTQKYPDGANRDKFLFVQALTRLNRGEYKSAEDALSTLVKQYPKSELQPMADQIVKGLQTGRKVGAGGMDFGGLWALRNAPNDSLSATKNGKAPTFNGNRRANFLFLVAYVRDSLDDNRLLYDLAQFNFSNFYVRNFDISKQNIALYAGELYNLKGKNAEKERSRVLNVVTFSVSGFRSFDEAHRYAQSVFKSPALAEQLRRAHVYLISDENLALIPRVFSFVDYQKFYDKAFAPLKLNTDLPLDENYAPGSQRYEDKINPIYPKVVKQTDQKDSLQTTKPGLPTEKVDSVATKPVIISDTDKSYPEKDNVNSVEKASKKEARQVGPEQNQAEPSKDKAETTKDKREQVQDKQEPAKDKAETTKDKSEQAQDKQTPTKDKAEPAKDKTEQKQDKQEADPKAEPTKQKQEPTPPPPPVVPEDDDTYPDDPPAKTEKPIKQEEQQQPAKEPAKQQPAKQQKKGTPTKKTPAKTKPQQPAKQKTTDPTQKKETKTQEKQSETPKTENPQKENPQKQEDDGEWYPA